MYLLSGSLAPSDWLYSLYNLIRTLPASLYSKWKDQIRLKKILADANSLY